MDFRSDHIGLDRRIRFEWIEYVVNLAKSGITNSQIKQALLDELSNHLSVGKSAVNRGNGEKTATILMKIWVNVPPELKEFRDEALRLFDQLSNEHHLVLHWGMTIAVYPFWAFVASNVGKLINLQTTFTQQQIQRRVQENYGQRLVIKDATRRVLSSMIDWGVLSQSSTKGSYEHGSVLPVKDPVLIAWLMESQLHGSVDKKAPLRLLINADCLFPFKIDRQAINRLRALKNRFEIINQGLDDSLVVLNEKEVPHV